MSYNKARRPSFSKAQRQAIWDSCNGICHWCLKPIGNDPWDAEHVIARELMEGKDADDPSNLAPIHRHGCHPAKTALDRKMIARSNRIIKRIDGTRRPRKPIPGRGFDKTMRKKMDGTVVKRNADT